MSIYKQLGKMDNEGFQTEYRIENVRNKPKLFSICNRKSGYLLIYKRISRPSDSKVMLGDYGYFWNKSKEACIQHIQYYS